MKLYKKKSKGFTVGDFFSNIFLFTKFLAHFFTSVFCSEAFDKNQGYLFHEISHEKKNYRISISTVKLLPVQTVRGSAQQHGPRRYHSVTGTFLSQFFVLQKIIRNCANISELFCLLDPGDLNARSEAAYPDRQLYIRL